MQSIKPKLGKGLGQHKDKNRGMNISGVKNLLSSNTKKLDDLYDHGLKSSSYKNFIRLKSKELLKKINKIKIYGKKNSS